MVTDGTTAIFGCAGGCSSRDSGADDRLAADVPVVDVACQQTSISVPPAWSVPTWATNRGCAPRTQTISLSPVSRWRAKPGLAGQDAYRTLAGRAAPRPFGTTSVVGWRYVGYSPEIGAAQPAGQHPGTASASPTPRDSKLPGDGLPSTKLGAKTPSDIP